ncbi:MAG: thiamine pyrophosphate-requiring protein [SAR202 cluster bacterium]|jgi:acetolactate synthase-1/2/3 large subunit|nr:MAG: thiamine pyrophosphate-requiring protein [SAR202 cluster bacterium]KAA1298129.1 MAG: thiamine pyrophosphate-requiring protein [SAR202 cluster bacterium]|tara:strand:- start:12624 stop:14297 length:1674 start_codon:yes stop_codon:yes gene_type:complete
MNGYDAVVDILKKEGFEWIACFPANPLIEAAGKGGLRPIVFRQERGGIMAADGYARMLAKEGKRGVFCSQGGPGIENSFGGFAQAWAEAVPVLYLPAGSPANVAEVKPNFDPQTNFAHITKWHSSITKSSEISTQMRRAMSALKNGRPGPVLLEMRSDAMAGEVDNTDDYSSPNAIVTSPSLSDVKDAIKALGNAKNPVIWAGQGVLYGAATEELKEFAEIMQIPVITTMPGKSAFDERHPLSLGAANRTAPKAVWSWLKDSDVLIGLGASFSKTTFGIDIPEGKFIIHNTNNVEDIDKEYSTEIGLLGDVKSTLRMLIDEAKGNYGDSRTKDTKTVESIAQVKQEWEADWAPLLNSNDVPINPYRLITEINNAVDHENTIMTHDAGHPRDQIMPFYPATVPNSYIGWGKSTHLGYGLPLVIGAKIAHPEKFCVNFMGDTAFGLSGLDLETSVRSGSPITTILLNNSTMGGYDHHMPIAMERYGAGNNTGSYTTIAEGLGAKGIYVEKPEEIVPAIKDAQKTNNDGQSALIEVITQQEGRFSRYYNDESITGGKIVK